MPIHLRILTNLNHDRLVKKDGSNVEFWAPKYKQHLETLKNFLSTTQQTDDFQNLTSLLTYDMELGSFFNFTRKVYADGCSTAPEHWANVRPFIEWLFLEKPDEFIELIELITLHSPQAYIAFVRSLNDTYLSEQKLFQWTEKMGNTLAIKITEMKNYAAELSRKHIAKGPLANEIADDLTRQLEAQQRLASQLRNPENKKDELKFRVETLKFKLKFQQTLHSQDEELNKHRGWGRLAVNVLTILFTAAIPNFVNLCATGNFLFFNKVKTKQHVKGIDKELGFRI